MQGLVKLSKNRQIETKMRKFEQYNSNKYSNPQDSRFSLGETRFVNDVTNESPHWVDTRFIEIVVNRGRTNEVIYQEHPCWVIFSNYCGRLWQ